MYGTVQPEQKLGGIYIFTPQMHQSYSFYPRVITLSGAPMTTHVRLLFSRLFIWGCEFVLFEKSISYDLSPLVSDLDGSPLLHISKGAAQHCPLHLITKNSKAELDVMKSRAFAIDAVTTPCGELVQHIKRHIAAFS